MPVERVKTKAKRIECVLVCDSCRARSKPYLGSSPAAPELSACEAANADAGWAYDIGFFSMLVGHTVYCPSCARS